MLKNDYPLSRCCAVLSLARSAYYYRAVPPAETQLLAAIEQIGAQFPTYGTRRMRELRAIGQGQPPIKDISTLRSRAVSFVRISE